MRCDNGILDTHFSRPLSATPARWSIPCFAERGTFQKKKLYSQPGKQDVIIVNVIVLISRLLFPSHTHTYIHTYIEPLVQTTGADPLRERDFHVACSSSVRGVSASLAGDRNLNHGVSLLQSYHHTREEGLGGHWASSKQGIALFTTLQRRRWISFAVCAFDDCNLFGWR